MKVPADVDQLMWFLAESGDDAALSEFRKRYPDFEIELLRRQSVVRGLKGARPGEGGAPIFKPSEAALELPTQPAKWPWVLGGVALAGLAMASYMVTTKALTPPTKAPDHEVAVQIPKGRLENDPNPRPETPGAPNGSNEPKPVYPGQQTHVPSVREDGLRAWQKPQTVTLEEAPLHAVLQSIAAQCGMTIEIAPNTPNPTVGSVRFDGITGVQMLKELGRSYSFTPLEQEPGTYLIVPAMDFTDLN